MGIDCTYFYLLECTVTPNFGMLENKGCHSISKKAEGYE